MTSERCGGAAAHRIAAGPLRHGAVSCRRPLCANELSGSQTLFAEPPKYVNVELLLLAFYFQFCNFRVVFIFSRFSFFYEFFYWFVFFVTFFSFSLFLAVEFCFLSFKLFFFLFWFNSSTHWISYIVPSFMQLRLVKSPLYMLYFCLFLSPFNVSFFIIVFCIISYFLFLISRICSSRFNAFFVCCSV